MDRHGLQEFGGGGGGQQEVMVVDGAFLMELLEVDTPAAAEQDQQEDGGDVDDRLSRVMRSLEAEIIGGTAAATAPAWVADSGSSGGSTGGVPASGVKDDGNGGMEQLEDMLPDGFDGSRGSSMMESAPPPQQQQQLSLPLEYWAEMPPAMVHDMGGWCVDGDGVVAAYELREPCYFTYGESSHVEQLQAYSPLWE